MACSNGLRAKPGLGKLQFLAAADINCAIYGESSIICRWVRVVTLNLPIALVNIDDYCASPIDRPSELLIFDFISGDWKKKLLDLAFSEKTNDWCECIPAPPATKCWQFGGNGVNESGCQKGGLIAPIDTEFEPFFELSNAGFPCTYEAVLLNGVRYPSAGAVYGYFPGTAHKRSVSNL